MTLPLWRRLGVHVGRARGLAPRGLALEFVTVGAERRALRVALADPRPAPAWLRTSRPAFCRCFSPPPCAAPACPPMVLGSTRLLRFAREGVVAPWRASPAGRAALATSPVGRFC